MRLTMHELAVRDSDDDPELAVVGRPELGVFVELPQVGVEAFRQLDQGFTVAEVGASLFERYGVDLDVGGLAQDLTELGFVATLDGVPLPDPGPRIEPHLPWLRPQHVRWLFSAPVAVAWLALVAASGYAWWVRPDSRVDAGDFFWTDYVGLAVLVNTLMFSANATVHELMHLAAARACGAPARIGFATRLHHLVAQTDVTAIWTAPRRDRYRVYLAGILWDCLLVAVGTLLIAFAGFPQQVDQLLSALLLLVLLSVILQAHVYMRVDLYYVLMELLRCGNLFQDGCDYVRHLVRQLTRVPTRDPTLELPLRQRRAVRIYAVAMALGSAVALTAFAVFGFPVLVGATERAVTGVVEGSREGDLPRLADSLLVILIEGAIQVAFLVTFWRQHRMRLSRARKRFMRR